ncbi:hypothetical protein ACGFX8_30570 [Streptomyces sp. NPDC048362]|uniref:hypothetical protein n=1 Tax=Streptomyces sp. NPDC048362 TaxID=3365539 RepID=UPI0037227435
MHPQNTPRVPAQRATELHQPTPITQAAVVPASMAAMQPASLPTVASVVLPDGRIVTGYAIHHAQPQPAADKPTISRAAVNVALGGVGFLAVCSGLLLLTSFITALTAFIGQLVILAAVIFGGWIAVQVFSGGGHRDGRTTVNIRRAVFKRNHFHS